MPLRLTPSQKALCKALSHHPQEDRRLEASAFLHLMGDQAALEFAKRNEVASIVGHVLVGPTGASWNLEHRRVEASLNAFLRELDEVSGRLQTKNIPLVALKNGGIARGIYPCPGCCPMGDLDVLVERRFFIEAHQCLVEAGYQFAFRSALEEQDLAQAEQSGGTEYWKYLPDGQKFWLELQWRPVAGRWIRPDQEPSAEELIARSIPIPGTAVRLLAPEDNLLQVCLHTAKHSYVRAPGFRLHLDVDRIVHYQQLNWDVFLQRVVSLQVRTAVFFSLAIPAALFDTPVPAYVFDALRPAQWKEKWLTAWLNRVGLFNPDEKKFSRVGYILFTALLYDDFAGLWRSVFPDPAWMRQRYNITHDYLLPFYHLRRWFDLAFRRLKT